MKRPDPATAAQPRQTTLERSFDATLEEVWALWTTAEGIESWWGPEGFEVKVQQLELRPGGAMRYVMSAVGREQVAFMKNAGMPLSTEVQITFTEITPPRRLAFSQRADFISGVAPYDVALLVELHPGADGVRMVLTLDAMHDEMWTQRALMGWRSQFDKLAQALQSRAAARR